jgi:hypothetical protein
VISDEEEEEEEESTEKEEGFSLKNIFNFMKGSNSNNNNKEEDNLEQAINRPPPSPLTNARPTPRPTPSVPIRTSTPNYDYGSNFLQNKRSSVTVDSVGAKERDR